MLKLGVVIVTYNRINLLKECIEACLKQTYQFTKIIVINNNSSDDTEKYLQNFSKDDKFIIKNLPENIGGAGGFYEGVKESSQNDLDYTLLIDDDAIIDNKFNEEIVKNIKDEILAYSGSVITNNKIQYDHRKILLKAFNAIDSKKEDYEKSFFDYNLASFCGLYIANKLIKDIGLPKKEFFIWFDDTEYSLRINKKSKIRNVNTAILNHKTQDSRTSGYSWKSYYGIRNQVYIYKNYYAKKYYYKYLIYLKFMSIAAKIMKILKNDNYYEKVSEIYTDALKDGKNNKYGRNEKYIPGVNFKKR